MIYKEELSLIGKLTKTHGIKGELSLQVKNEYLEISEFPYIVCEIDGIYVPFFVEETRPKTNLTVLVKLENIDSEPKARELTGLNVFLPKNMLDDSDISSEFGWDDFIGFSVTDETQGYLGKITAVDESTINVLFCIENNENELLIPANEDLIIEINPKEKTMLISIPDGLLNLN